MTNELAHERRIMKAQMAAERARRRWATSLMRLSEIAMQTSDLDLDTVGGRAIKRALEIAEHTKDQDARRAIITLTKMIDYLSARESQARLGAK